MPSLLRRSFVSVCLCAGIFTSFFPSAGMAYAQPTGGAAVSFATHDASGNRLVLRAMLWLPAGPARAAVVLVHGSGGWSDFREGYYGRALRAAGYAALAIDTFGPRGIKQTINDQSQISVLQMTRDAFAARRLLLARGFAAERLAIMGFSKGGAVALYAADRNFLPAQVDRFAVAIPFYPGCNIHPRTPKPASRVFMLLAEKDNYTGIKPCQEIADDFRKAGGTISVKIYPNASHAFDGNPASTRKINLRFAQSYKECTVYLEENGWRSYAGKKYAPADTSLLADLRNTCMRRGATVWTNLRQKHAATRDVIEFLNDSFPKGP
ncbi:MAG: dienelactone hydrolase family protein [Gammaproteobacteria bacterium]|nr:dienelactone hydrolase family protein [Gammaproteobacteria bacterium]